MTTASDSLIAPRRALATRNTTVARWLARSLAARGVRPNTVSLCSVVFAGVPAAAFGTSPYVSGRWRPVLFLVAAAGIQLRLLCNLLDGMLAVEEGLKSATGDIFNEVPDRVADVIILAGAGYSAGLAGPGPILGWVAALTAVFTAYVRVFGGSLGLRQHFSGPMAKQHRMFTLTLAALLAALEASLGLPPRAITAGLTIVILGSGWTAARRVRRIVREAQAR